VATKLGKIVADFSTSLATSIAIGATSVTLASATDDDGVALPAGVYFFSLDGNNSQKEHIVATLSGTSLTGISSVSRQGVQSSGVVRTHRVGATVALTDFAHIKYLNDLLTATTDLDHLTPLKYDGTASITNANHLATKAYVDGVAIAGGTDASTTVKGITKMSVAPASATAPIAVGDNDDRVPTQSENDAMAGTSGTAVSSTNPFVDRVTLTGAIVMWGTTTAPAGWLLCDGSAVSRSTYATLFAIIGTNFGVGDGSTTFNVPLYKGKTPVGYDASQTEFNAIAKAGGEKTHTLITSEMPAHTHTVSAGGGSTSNPGGSGNVALTSSSTSGSTGGDGAHNNLQPYVTVTFIIKT
jgi:microcystin-dependent protein